MRTYYNIYVQCAKCGEEIVHSLWDVKPEIGDRELACGKCQQEYEDLTGISYDEFVAVEVMESGTIKDPEELSEWYEESGATWMAPTDPDYLFQWNEEEGRYILTEEIQIVQMDVMAAPPWRLPEREWVALSEIPAYVRKSEGAIRQDWKRGKFDEYIASGLVQTSGGVHLIHLDAVREVYREEWVGDGSIEVEKKFSICIDLNGVIDTYSGWKGEDHEELPREGAKEFLEELSRKYRVYIHTTQPVPKVWKWLDRHNLSDYVARVTNRKVPALIYLDDRAIRFDGDFEKALEEIRSFRPHWKR